MVLEMPFELMLRKELYTLRAAKLRVLTERAKSRRPRLMRQDCCFVVLP